VSTTEQETAADTQPEALVERRGAVQVITINRPTQRNALTRAASLIIAAAVDELDADDDLAVGVLTGAGGTFCSGMDLAGFLKGETPSLPGRGMAGIARTPPRKPLIAAVEGWAVAGGFELTLSCDLVVAARTARFGIPEVKRGLVAGAGAAVKLPSRIPYAVALEMLLTGDPISAEKAEAVGLVNRIVDEGGALDEAVRLAESIAANGPLAVAATKEIAKQSRFWGPDEVWDRQDEIMMPVFASEDAKEGARAFKEKRAPVWRSR
jgi:enoyl-CoA hydratase